MAVDLAREHPEHLRVVGLAAGASAAALAAQAVALGPARVVLPDAASAARFQAAAGSGFRGAVDTGPDGLAALASAPEVDVILIAATGLAGLPALQAALAAGRRVAVASKEPLVAAWGPLAALARATGARLEVVDSELWAAGQLLEEPGSSRPVGQLILTASGGPLLGRDRAALDRATVAEALAHPVWPMGRKISVDSATLVNKAFEVVIAHHRFGVPAGAIAVLVHPEAVAHALVRRLDGTLHALLAAPDMRLPLAAALGLPEGLVAGRAAVDLPGHGALRFQAPDAEAFPGVRLGHEALARGPLGPAALVGADEAAALAFLQGRIALPAIPEVIRAVLGLPWVAGPGDDLAERVEAVDRARIEAGRILGGGSAG
jgi:1-deoxy-D-xylulose-5-phosphate reductoisomerase